MIPMLRNFRSKAKVATLASVFLLSFSLYGLYCINTVNEVKINGALYQRIAQGKDVVADILPPPEYLIETYLTAYQMLDASDASEVDALSARCTRLKAEYLERHAYWQWALPAGELKSTLIGGSYEPAIKLLDTLEAAFLPAIRAADKTGDKTLARDILQRSIKPAYSDHRARIDQVVEIARKEAREAEAGAAIAVRSRIYGQVFIGLLLFAFLSVFSYSILSMEERDRARRSDSEAEPVADPVSRTRG